MCSTACKSSCKPTLGRRVDPAPPAAAAQGDALVVQYTRDVTAVLQQRSLASGALVREVPLPGLGSLGVSGRREQSEVLYTYTSMTEPGSTYRCTRVGDGDRVLGKLGEAKHGAAHLHVT